MNLDAVVPISFEGLVSLREVGKENLDILRDRWIDKFYDTLYQLESIGDYLVMVTKALNEAEEKPLFVGLRQPDHFSLGDEVVLFHNGNFIPGRVIAIENGILTIFTEMVIRQWNECGLETSMFRPEILKPSEYEYLQKHPKFLELWMEANKNYEIDEEQYKKAIILQ